MHGHALALFVLLFFSGLLRGLEDGRRMLVSLVRARRAAGAGPPQGGTPDPSTASLPRLNAIELSLIANLSLEMAQENEALARNMTQRPETRARAAEAAAAWRERARRFQSEAQRLGSHPILPGDPSTAHAAAYAGPERRRQMRRRQTRAAGTAAAVMGLGPWDRRAGGDRRDRERRGEPAPSRSSAG